MEISGKQREILEFMIRYQEEKGYPPAVREIGAAVGLSSTSTVHGHLSRLESKGYIRRDPSKPRAIEIVKVPEPAQTQTKRAASNTFNPSERVVAFQKIAENCSRYLHKGSLVYVEGSLQTRKWQDQQGNERTMVEVRAQRVSFLDRRQPQDEFQRSEGQGGMGENDYGQRSSYSENRYSRYESYQNDSEPSSSPYGAPGQRYERQPHGLSDEQFEPAEDGGSESALDKVPF